MIELITSKKNGQNGITLLALVLTIIVLLILAGITINMTIGDNGLMDNVKNSKEEVAVENFRRELDVLLLNIKTEPVKEDETNEEMLERYAVEAQNYDWVESVVQEGNRVRIKAKSENNTYEFVVSIKEVKLIENSGDAEEEISETEESEIVKIKYDMGKWNDSKEVTLETESGYDIEYAIGDEEKERDQWVQYDETRKITINRNNTKLYARIDDNGKKGKISLEVITNIDTLSPKTLEITNITSENDTAELTVHAEDGLGTDINGLSGIAKFEFSYKTDGGYSAPVEQTVIPNATSDITYKYTGLNQKKVYTLRVVAYDQAGNYKEITTQIDKSATN